MNDIKAVTASAVQKTTDVTRRPPPVALYVILVAFTVLGLLYSAFVPIFEASDEVWHYPMVEHLARTWILPVQPLEPGASSGPWRQEASQPPLYYALAAALTTWIDTSPTASPYDLDTVRHLNPHVAAGEVMPDSSNPNLVVHNPALERLPWRGVVLAIHIVRIFSVLLGTWAVYLTWALVCELFPEQPQLALIAAAIHAFTPMYLFVSASVNNDNLVIPLCSLALLMMIRLVKGQEARGKGQEARGKNHESCILRHFLLGVAIGLGLLTKASAIALLPFAVATIAWGTWQNLKWRMGESANERMGELEITHHAPLLPTPYSLLPKITFHALRNLILILLPALAISGWWFYRNFQLYGDWLGLNAFYAVLGTRDVTADLAQLWAERFAFAAGYWGNFGGLNVPMPRWIYTVLNLFAILAGINLVVGFGLWVVNPKLKVESSKLKVPSSSSDLPPSPTPRYQSPITTLWPFAWDELTAARALAWAWPVAVFVSWIRWATITWSSQGRLIFSAIPMWSLALALPITNYELRITNSTLSRVIRHSLFAIRYSLPTFLFALCLIALPVWIVPAYAPPRATRDTLTTPPLRTDFGNVLRLTGFQIDRRSTIPGDTVGLTLQWMALAPTTADHSLFIHVLGEDERIIAQRDTFPGRGLLSTTWLEPGHTWIEHYEIAISPLAYAPDSLAFAVGMYGTATGTRLPLQADPPFTVMPTGDIVTFGDVWLSEAAESTEVFFGKGIVLTDYDLSDVIVPRGETLQATLHWRCAASIDGDYTISVQLIDAQWNKAAQSDAWPLDGAAPTSSWQVGQTIDEPRALNIAADVTPGVYNLQLAIYHVNAEGELEHLPIVWEKGQMPAKTVVLTRVRVE
ncbi:MAG: glycosyltransferase family 39 protein [Anaerolineae bacterium]|nr:glycosyltransferase family 39 protein [Anaerolineae bacterium]